MTDEKRQASDCDDDEDILDEVWDRIEKEGLKGRPLDAEEYKKAAAEWGHSRGGAGPGVGD